MYGFRFEVIIVWELYIFFEALHFFPITFFCAKWQLISPFIITMCTDVFIIDFVYVAYNTQ